jgi:hypothetical protein
VSESGTPIPICKTEVRRNDLNPTWKPVVLNLQQIGSKVRLFFDKILIRSSVEGISRTEILYK